MSRTKRCTLDHLRSSPNFCLNWQNMYWGTQQWLGDRREKVKSSYDDRWDYPEPKKNHASPAQLESLDK
uniref:Uncharacterized protein n=1 Tax=Arion vulgaris TaxID=1028688 RepID=A0A0B7ARF0_9EUPU